MGFHCREKIFDQILDWIHAQIVSFLGEFFGMINNMGAELFDFVWVQAIVLFFQYLAWTLFAVGIILAVFETAIAYQNGQGNVSGVFLNILKGFLATSLITVVPIELLQICCIASNIFIDRTCQFDRCRRINWTYRFRITKPHQ